jgi:type I restriction enzyme S subunit
VTTLKPLLLDTRDGEWGKGEPSSDRVEMRVIRGTDFDAVRQGQVDSVPTRFLERRHADRKRLRAWDIVLETAGGSPDRPTGRTILVKPRTIELLGEDLTCASFARFLRVNPELADPAYLFWLLQHHYECRDLLAFHTQHTGVARFQYTTFSNSFEFELPPLPTQRRIASILGTYDDLIEVNRRRIAVLEEMARGLFSEWFVCLRFPGHEAVHIEDTPTGPLPQGWSWGRFADLASEVRDTVSPEAINPETPYVGLEHISRRSTTLAEHGAAADVSSLKAQFRRGDILFGKIRPYFHKVAWAPFDGVASTDAIIWRPTPGRAAQALLQASDDAFVAHSVQTSNGTKMPRANNRVLAEYLCPLAPSNISERFENAVGSMIESAASLQAENLVLAASRDLLLPRLISGQLSVTQAERELEVA